MAALKCFSVLKWRMIILYVIALFILIYFIHAFYGQQKEEEHLDISLPQSTPNTSIVGTSWQDYVENWDGEILITTDPVKKVIIFTEEYQLKMKSKGPHPLTMEHERFFKRAEIMDRYCNADPSLSQGRYWYGEGLRSVLFNDESKLLFCTVPKISSTTWSYVFMKMLDPTYNMSVISTKYPKYDGISLTFSVKDEKLIATRYQTYTKFIVARNPFERLLSAYTDKFTKRNTYYEPQYAHRIIITNYLSDVSKEMIESARKNLREGKANLITGLDGDEVKQIGRLNAGLGKYKLTFLEFLNYLIAAATASGVGSFDYHWRPVTAICNPCSVRYDIIVNFETLHEDSKVILDYVQRHITREKVEFPVAEYAIKNNSCNEAFMEIPIDVRNRIYQLFKEDFLLFGYKYNGNSTNDILC